MTMPFRYPDAPTSVPASWPGECEKLFPGEWCAQPKGDGWRKPAYLEGGEWTFHAKSHAEGKLPPEDLREELASLGWGDAGRVARGLALDMEWIGPRQVAHLGGRHEFWIFDIHYSGGKWMGSIPFVDRWENLLTIFSIATKGRSHPRVKLVPTWTEGFQERFEEQKRDPLSEGLVLKSLAGRLIGSRTRVAKSAAMMKAKYRE
jgi:hypothetical protein